MSIPANRAFEKEAFVLLAKSPIIARRLFGFEVIVHRRIELSLTLGGCFHNEIVTETSGGRHMGCIVVQYSTL